MRSFTLLASALLLVSTLSAAQRSYTPADPDKYPYPSVVTDKNGDKINVDGAKILPDTFEVTEVYRSPFSGKNYNLGKKATAQQVKAWNTDTRPDGKGLPEGSMKLVQGAAIYAKKCASCHGDFGEGVGRYPVLAGGRGTLTLHPSSGGDAAPLKTVGSYLPYISPLFWYIQTAMPLTAPKSLSNSEVYGIMGYILQLSDIKVNGADIEDETVIDRAFINAVHMPNEKGFEYNNLRVSDTNNTRCMKDCIDTSKMNVMHIVTDATIVEPPFGEERWSYTKIKKDESFGKSAYKNTCAVCHDAGLAGAPIVGDKAAWARVTKKSLKEILGNAINGLNGMPPRGGDASLEDKQVEEIVNYMIEASK
jgi:cytochrome c